jgi:hypothetical protein
MLKKVMLKKIIVTLTPGLTVYYPTKESILSVAIRFSGLLLYLFLLFYLINFIWYNFSLNNYDNTSLIIINILVYNLFIIILIHHIKKSLVHLKKENQFLKKGEFYSFFKKEFDSFLKKGEVYSFFKKGEVYPFLKKKFILFFKNYWCK